MLKAVAKHNKDAFNVEDLIKVGQPEGAMQYSVLLQDLKIVLPEHTNKMQELLRSWVIHLNEIAILAQNLIKNGLVIEITTLPAEEDDTRVVGKVPEDGQPHFLPNLTIAANLMALLGKDYAITEELRNLIKYGFKTPDDKRYLRLRRKMDLYFSILLFTIVLMTLVLNYRFDQLSRLLQYIGDMLSVHHI